MRNAVMPEGRVYLCSWEQTGKAFRLWVKSRPKVQGRGRSYEKAEEALLDKICMHFDDGEAVLEFDRPLPVSDRVARFLNPSLVTVCGNTCPDEYGPIEQLYSGGICRECGAAIGERTSVPLQVSALKSGYEGGFVIDRFADIVFFSERFLGLLRPREKRGLELRPIVRAGRSRKQFFELIAKPPVPHVFVKGLGMDGSQCGTCGRREFSQYESDFPIHDFVAKRDLPKPLPTCFAIGSIHRVELCLTEERWQELVTKPGARGLVGREIGVVEESECGRNPKLRSYREVMSEAIE
jgi:hypothetical protein